MLYRSVRQVHESARALNLTLKESLKQPSFTPSSIGLPSDFMLTSIATFKG